MNKKQLEELIELIVKSSHVDINVGLSMLGYGIEINSTAETMGFGECLGQYEEVVGEVKANEFIARMTHKHLGHLYNVDEADWTVTPKEFEELVK